MVAGFQKKECGLKYDIETSAGDHCDPQNISDLYSDFRLF